MFLSQFVSKNHRNIIKQTKSLTSYHQYTTNYKISTTKAVFKMSDKPNLLKPPDQVQGIQKLDRKLFDKPVKIPILRIKNMKISSIMPAVKKYLLKMEKLKPIVNTIENETIIYLNPNLISEWSSFSAQDREHLENSGLSNDNFNILDYNLAYENFSSDSVLKAVLPSEHDGFSSFTKVGHIVHVNLREHLLPFKEIIGQVLLDKTPNCTCVVNKTNNIDNTYRNFKMEVLAGNADFIVEIRENSCRFRFDFSTVYWNSRLCTEHERIVKKMSENDALFDVFAGVGPFAIPAAKKGCIVFANDLNPESHKWLNHNSQLNKIQAGKIQIFNQDGREFIQNNFHNFIKLIGKRHFIVTMNLPAMAVDFLDAFFGILDKDEVNDDIAGVAYVYCFAKGENCDFEELSRSLVIEKVGVEMGDKIEEVVRVRTVSNFKEMMRVKVRLDRAFLCGLLATNKRKCDANEESYANKKICQNGEEQGKEDE